MAALTCDGVVVDLVGREDMTLVQSICAMAHFGENGLLSTLRKYFPEVSRKGKKEELRQLVMQQVSKVQALRRELDTIPGGGPAPEHEQADKMRVLTGSWLVGAALGLPSRSTPEPAVDDGDDDAGEAGEAAADGDGARGRKKKRKTARPFGVDEMCRLLHTIFMPEMRLELDRLSGEHKPRWVQDDKLMKTPWECVADQFNTTHSFEHPAPDDEEIKDVDPNSGDTKRGGKILAEKFAALKSAYTPVFENWDSSGKMSGANDLAQDKPIQDFIQPDTKYATAIIYMHYLTKGDDSAISFGTRLVEAGARFESGVRRSGPREDTPGGKRQRGGGGALDTANMCELKELFACIGSAGEQDAAATKHAADMERKQALYLGMLSTPRDQLDEEDLEFLAELRRSLREAA